MCLKKFWGYTCGHCSPPSIVKCPVTDQNENFPACSIPAENPVFANQFCHACMRINWNRMVLDEENAHKERHERGECSCGVVFDRGLRERREAMEREAKERVRREREEREIEAGREREVRALRNGGADLEAWEMRREMEGGAGAGAGGRNGGGRGGRMGGRGRGRGGVARSAGATEQNGEMNGEGRGHDGMMRGLNGGFMMDSAPSRYSSPRPTDPASAHRYFHFANTNMGNGQMGNTGQGIMNPITGVINGFPISSPPPMTSSSQMHGDMMVIPRSPSMSAMGVYPMGHPILANMGTDNHQFGMPPLPPAEPSNWQSPGMPPATHSNGNGSNGVYHGSRYSWSPNGEPTRPSVDHRASYNQVRTQHANQPDYGNLNGNGYHQIDPDVQRNAYNYVGYYIERHTESPHPRAVPMTEPQTTGYFVRAPTISALPGGAPGGGIVWHASHNSLPLLPPQIPTFGDVPAVPTGPRYFNESPSVSRRNVRTTPRIPIVRSRTSQSLGQITTTGRGPMELHTIPATTTQGQAAIHSGTTRVTTQDQSQGGSEHTPAAMNIALLRTPRVISSMPRPNSTI
ncbi:hypothetical protein NHQ30_009072 [Ciborinia camelliae]|nr:hypothetical protein NHQ30_009072 [Ciborinia camelliae]